MFFVVTGLYMNNLTFVLQWGLFVLENLLFGINNTETKKILQSLEWQNRLKFQSSSPSSH